MNNWYFAQENNFNIWLLMIWIYTTKHNTYDVLSTGCCVHVKQLTVNQLNDIARLNKLSPRATGVTCYMGSQSVPSTRHEWTPPSNPSQSGWFLINLPQRDGRLSWPKLFGTYWNGLPVSWQSPVQVATVPSIRWKRPTCYHYTKQPPNMQLLTTELPK